MSNIADILKYPSASIPSKGKLMNMPLDKTTEGTGHKFLKSIVQYLTMNPWTGYVSELPQDIKLFFRETPMHPAYGSGLGL